MERHPLPEPQRLQLVSTLQEVTNLPLPRKDLYLGNIMFFLRKHDTKNQFDFQIRWGSKNILVVRNIAIASNDVENKDILQLLEKNRDDIRRKLIEYCIEQLNNIVTIELPLHIQKSMPAFQSFDLFVNLCRNPKRKQSGTGTNWPPISVFISWDDETGVFQELVYPLEFDETTAHFNLDYEDIIKELNRYRDTI